MTEREPKVFRPDPAAVKATSILGDGFDYEAAEPGFVDGLIEHMREKAEGREKDGETEDVQGEAEGPG